MRPGSGLVALAVGLGLLAAPSLVAADGPPPTEAAEALRHYLLIDCGVDEEGAALRELLRHAEALETELARLLLDGPDDAALDALAADLEAAWERRSAFLASDPRLGLAPEAYLAVSSLSRTDYFARETRRFDLASRERAAAALAAIGTPTARRTLRGALDVVDEEVRDFVARALERRRPRHLRRPDGSGSGRTGRWSNAGR
jgi:hypothetical protein